MVFLITYNIWSLILFLNIFRKHSTIWTFVRLIFKFFIAMRTSFQLWLKILAILTRFLIEILILITYLYSTFRTLLSSSINPLFAKLIGTFFHLIFLFFLHFGNFYMTKRTNFSSIIN